jgi:hypothetical protein
VLVPGALVEQVLPGVNGSAVENSDLRAIGDRSERNESVGCPCVDNPACAKLSAGHTDSDTCKCSGCFVDKSIVEVGNAIGGIVEPNLIAASPEVLRASVANAAANSDVNAVGQPSTRDGAAVKQTDAHIKTVVDHYVSLAAVSACNESMLKNELSADERVGSDREFFKTLADTACSLVEPDTNCQIDEKIDADCREFQVGSKDLIDTKIGTAKECDEELGAELLNEVS